MSDNLPLSDAIREAPQCRIVICCSWVDSPEKIQFRRRIFALQRRTGFALHQWTATRRGSKINEMNSGRTRGEALNPVHSMGAKKSKRQEREQSAIGETGSHEIRLKKGASH